MLKKYLLIGFAIFALLFGAFANNAEPEKKPSDVKNVDIKYNFDINGFILDFPDYTHYKAILYSNADGWEYKLFYKDIMLKQKVIENTNINTETTSSSQMAIDLIFEDIIAYEAIKLALQQKIN